MNHTKPHDWAVRVDVDEMSSCLAGSGRWAPKSSTMTKSFGSTKDRLTRVTAYLTAIYCNMKTSPTKTSGSWQQASTLPECLGSAKLHPCNVSKFLSSRRDGRSTDRNAWRPGRSESSETKPTIENPTFSRVAEGLLASSHIF